jgi:hypothetical protein
LYKRYRGNKGIKGLISFLLVGGLYRATGSRSKIFGKIAFVLMLFLIGFFISLARKALLGF